MDRRRFFAAGCGTFLAAQVGCRGTQTGEVMTADRKDTVGSHAAGAETYKPLIDEALGKLLARQGAAVHPVGHPGVPPAAKRICFVGVENKSSEDLADIKAQLFEVIDTRVNTSGAFHQVSRRYVEIGLRDLRLRPDEMLKPENLRKFQAVMESQGAPFDYLLFATVTSGTTRDNDRTQKDYLLTLELVDVHTGTPDKESASLRKLYKKSHGLR
ncbi:MAG: penicillin-binding protein activator LpoB [Isosphaera sp.]|nr:penicillin-binding protein activator LpoB [Isosphaera sp.]